jgi:hypothetical protein
MKHYVCNTAKIFQTILYCYNMCQFPNHFCPVLFPPTVFPEAQNVRHTMCLPIVWVSQTTLFFIPILLFSTSKITDSYDCSGTHHHHHHHQHHLLLLLLFHWYYIPGWDLTSSMGFHHSSPDCALILQFLHPTCVMSSNSLHHLNTDLIFCLHLLLV